MILLKSNIYVSKDLNFAGEVLFRKFAKQYSLQEREIEEI